MRRRSNTVRLYSLKYSILYISLALPFSSFAANSIATFTLENGTKVELKDDHTWQYVVTEKPTTTASTPSSTSAAAIATSAAVVASSENATSKQSAETVATSAQSNANPDIVQALNQAPSHVNPRLSPEAMAHPELFGQTTYRDVKINLVDTKWKGDRLGLTFDLSSQNKDDVIKVTVKASFYDDTGAFVQSQDLVVWRAIKRLPETYLRANQTRESEEVWVTDMQSETWKKHYLTLEVTALEVW